MLIHPIQNVLPGSTSVRSERRRATSCPASGIGGIQLSAVSTVAITDTATPDLKLPNIVFIRQEIESRVESGFSDGPVRGMVWAFIFECVLTFSGYLVWHLWRTM